MTGIEPYSPNGESCSYSNTSRLYRRYGSEYAAFAFARFASSSSVASRRASPPSSSSPAARAVFPFVSRRLRLAARSGIPYTCTSSPGKERSNTTAIGPRGRVSVWPLKVSFHVSFGPGPFVRSRSKSNRPSSLNTAVSRPFTASATRIGSCVTESVMTRRDDTSDASLRFA